MNYFLNIIIFLYIFSTHTMSKVSVVLGDSFDTSMSLGSYFNITTLIISTYLAAIAKILFAFTENLNLRKLTAILFGLLAVCMFSCFILNHYGLFLFMRSIQGLFAGLLNALIIGLIGKYYIDGFKWYAIYSAISCFVTVFALAFLNVRIIGITIMIFCLLGVFFSKYVQNDLTKKELSKKEFVEYIKNPDIIQYSVICGTILAITLNLIFRCESLIINNFNIQDFEIFNITINTKSLAILSSLIPFSFGILTYQFRNKPINYKFIILLVLCLIISKSMIITAIGYVILSQSLQILLPISICSFLFGFCKLSIYYFLFGISGIYVTFILSQTFSSKIISKQSKKPYAASVIFFAMRTFITALMLNIITTFQLDIINIIIILIGLLWFISYNQFLNSIKEND